MSRPVRTRSELVARTRWYVYLRWFILLLVVVPSLISSYGQVGWGDRFIRDLIFCGFAASTNAVYHILTHSLRQARSVSALAYFIAITDVVLITFFIYTKGGIESRSVILYILPLLASSAILGRLGGYIAAALSISGYTLIILAGFYGWFGEPLSMFTPQLDSSPGYIANTIIFFDLTLAMIALGMDYMNRLLVDNEYKAQQAVRRLRRAQLIAKIGGWEYDIGRHELRYSDELFEIMHSILPSQIMGRDEFLALVHEDDRRMVRRKILSAVKQPRTISFEYRMSSQDGLVHYLHVDGHSYTDKSGIVTQVVGSARDITDERTLQKARTDFVALASHQLRTPATIVKQYVGMLKDGFIGPVTPEQQEFLDIAYDTNERQIKIVNDLLNVARIDSNSYKIVRKKTDINILLTEIARDQASKFIRKRQTLKLRVPTKPVTVTLDPDAVRMAIDNLLDNAYKYTPYGKNTYLSLTQTGRNALITVRDQGMGIAKRDLPKMFKMFSRVENPAILQQEGTGLGLYWAERIIRLHKGRISVISEPGKGTSFTITLPLR